MNNITETINDNIDNFPDGLYSQTRMHLLAWVLQVPTSIETVDVKVKIKMMKSIHTLRRDWITQVISCNPWSTRLHPYPSLIRKMKTYLELEGKLGTQPHCNHAPAHICLTKSLHHERPQCPRRLRRRREPKLQ